jgi:hypothetical protein
MDGSSEWGKLGRSATLVTIGWAINRRRLNGQAPVCVIQASVSQQMIRKLPFITLVLMLGCSAEDNQRIYVDPATGEEAVFEFTSQDNWKLYSGNEGKSVILERDDNPVAFINDFETGRTLSIASDYGDPATLTLIDEDFDGRYDFLKYGNGIVEVIDIGLDGVIDSLLNYAKEQILVNYRGEMFVLRGEDNNKYIIANGERIGVDLVDGVFRAKGR